MMCRKLKNHSDRRGGHGVGFSLIRRLVMPLPELENYYLERRKKRFEQGKELKHIRLRETLYPFFILFLTGDRLFRKQKITVLGGHKPDKEQVIYACTHIGENDLENIYESLRRGCWWFVGDPCVLYKDLSGLLLYLNGSIFLELADKEDRHIAYFRSIELLKGGGSLMIFPEGARNGSENLPVMPLFSGTAKMAMETNVKIIPVAIEQYDKRFVIKFGSEILPDNYNNHADLTQNLRDALATLKWEIWENEGIQSRNQLPENFREQFINTFEKRIQPWDTPETIERSRFHTKSEIDQKEVENHWDRLIPCKGNAFLFRKR